MDNNFPTWCTRIIRVKLPNIKARILNWMVKNKRNTPSTIRFKKNVMSNLKCKICKTWCGLILIFNINRLLNKLSHFENHKWGGGAVGTVTIVNDRDGGQRSEKFAKRLFVGQGGVKLFLVLYQYCKSTTVQVTGVPGTCTVHIMYLFETVRILPTVQTIVSDWRRRFSKFDRQTTITLNLLFIRRFSYIFHIIFWRSFLSIDDFKTIVNSW